MQPDPELPEAGGVKARRQREGGAAARVVPDGSQDFPHGHEGQDYAAAKPAEPKAEEKKAEVKKIVTGNAVTAPLPGRIIELKVKVGDGQGRRRDRSPGGHERRIP